MTTDVVLTPEIRPEGQQVDALRLMKEWFNNWRNNVPGTPQYFYLAGYAGTGKTFLMKYFLKEVGLSDWDVELLTFMARSAIILSRASGLMAGTIHSAIYKRAFVDRTERWVVDHESRIREAKLLILDECSTVGTNMIRDVLSFGRPCLILGDPGQLRPIGDDPFFQHVKPDFFLTEIRRQALGNPIIRVSMDFRNGHNIPYGDYTDYDGNVKVRKVRFDELPPEEWVAASIAITYRNDHRILMNETYRQFLGLAQQSKYPLKGDKLICLRNKMDIGLANGLLGTAPSDVKPPHPDELTFVMDFLPELSDIPIEDLECLSSYFDPKYDRFGSPIKDPEFLTKKRRHFYYGYCITCHKALGSQFERPILIDTEDQMNRNEWMYTGVSRAQDTLYIVA